MTGISDSFPEGEKKGFVHQAVPVLITGRELAIRQVVLMFIKNNNNNSYSALPKQKGEKPDGQLTAAWGLLYYSLSRGVWPEVQELRQCKELDQVPRTCLYLVYIALGRDLANGLPALRTQGVDTLNNCQHFS